jgi:hypothetical protein
VFSLEVKEKDDPSNSSLMLLDNKGYEVYSTTGVKVPEKLELLIGKPVIVT